MSGFDTRALSLRIKALRQDRGLSLQQVAQRAGATKSHIWELENGSSRNPSLTMMMGLANAFGVSLAELIGADTSKPRIRGDLANAISVVTELWGRAWDAGFQAGKVAAKAEGETP